MGEHFYDADNVVLSIIVCTHNRHELLGRAVESIEQQTLAKTNFELIIVDNSTDEDARLSFESALDPDLNCIYCVEERVGLSFARNRGVEYANGHIVAFLDDDALAASDWAQAIIEAFERAPEIGVIGGPVQAIWPTERPIWLHAWQEGFLTIVDRGQEARPLKEGEWLAGTNIAFKTELVKKFGGFDENLGRIGKLLLSNEELVLCEKISLAGHQLWYSPEIRVLHRVHGDRMSQAWLRRRVAFQAISDVFRGDKGNERQSVNTIEEILDFANTMPAKSRTIIGLFSDVQDPEIFQKQTAALAALVRFCLLDGRDWEKQLESAH